MAESFNPGDVVKLKSGGPAMTVEEAGRDASGNDRVWCTWYDGKEIKKDSFIANALKQAEA